MPSGNNHYMLQLLSDTTDKQQLKEILNILMTEKEQQELNNRLKIFALLQQGVTQREISTQLGVGIATVSRGAGVFQQHDVGTLLPNLNKALQ